MRQREPRDWTIFLSWCETSLCPANAVHQPYYMEGYVMVTYCRAWWPENPVCEWMVPGTYLEANITYGDRL